MLRQSEIVQTLAKMAFDVSHGDFDELVAEFELNRESSGVKIWQVTNGEKEYLSLFDTMEVVHDLIVELHNEVKNHTGGILIGLRLTLDSEGEARVKFHYGDELRPWSPGGL